MSAFGRFYKKLTSPMKYSLILIVYIILALFLFSIIIDNQIKETAAANLEQSLILQAGNIEKTTDQQLQALESLSAFVSAQDQLVNEHTMGFVNSLVENTMMSKVYVITSDGIAHANGNSSFNASDRLFFKQSMAGDRVVTKSLSTENDEEYRIVLSVPIYQNGKINGVVGGSFKLSDISQMIFPSQPFRSSGHIFVIDKHGEFITMDSSEYFKNEKNFFDYYTGVKLHHTSFHQIKEEMKNGKSNSYMLEKDGEVYYLVLTPMSIADWSLGYVIPTRVADEPYQFFSMHEMALFGVIMIGVLVYLIAIFRLVYDEQKQLYKQASYDSLTNLYNKKYTEMLISERLMGNQLKAILIIDLDDFKVVNDQYGHIVGDRFLSEVAKELKDMFWSYDIVGRIGGDEMMILMDQISNPEAVYKKCKKVIHRISQIQMSDDTEYCASCSIGIAFYPNDGETFESLYQKADKALYKMKKNGKKGYWIYEEQ